MILLTFLLLLIAPSIYCQSINASAFCSDAYKFPSGSEFGKNIPKLLDSLWENVSTTGYAASSLGNGADTVYGLFQCRGDLPSSQCRTCGSTAASMLNRTCVRNSTRGGRIQLGDCFFRYEDHFFSSTLDIVSSLTNCSQGNGTDSFRNNTAFALAYLQDRVPNSSSKFLRTVAGAGTSSQAYALGQCVPDLSSGDCGLCISSAEDALSSTCSGAGGACYYSTCMLEYQSFKFFSGTPENATAIAPALPPSQDSSKSKLIGIVAGTIGGVVLLLAAAFIASRLYFRKREGSVNELDATLYRGPVTFPYDMLKRCTGNFDESHRLGEGGFGAVYKGFFLDGTEVAIKRLSVASKQGEQQFLNEVKVISTVQHRNLVRLLGCCVQGSERLLVYEFCKNNSLEKALFDQSSKTGDSSLSWDTRFNILLGTARGLSYLHEDSQVRIVHRDIKPSNILLDETFEAKIADFGLARLCTEDEVSNIITTKIAGTYGYMAPEYAFHGEFSEKADVFSFGVVILETISGKRNRHQFLVEQLWELHARGGGEIFDQLLDPGMECSSLPDRDKIREVLRMSLMCTQASAQARPSMSRVVAMLAGHSNVYVPEDADFKPYSSSSSQGKGGAETSFSAPR